MNFGWTLYFEDVVEGSPEETRHFWSGEGDLVFTEPGTDPPVMNTWMGTQRGDAHLISIGAIENRVGAPERRLTLSIAIVTTELEDLLLKDIGPVGTQVGFLFSEDGGRTWQRPPGACLLYTSPSPRD